MAERLSVWSGLWRSAYDPAAYREAAAGSTGRMLGYFAVLVALATVVTTAQVSMIIGQGVREFRANRWWENNLPEIAITNGKASSDVPQPYRKEFPGGTVFILDTTGATTGVDASAPNTVLVTATQLIVRQNRRGQTQVHDLSKFPNVKLNEMTIEAWLEQVDRWFWLVIGLGLLIAAWVGKLLQVVFWSLLSLIVSAVSGRRLRYGAIFNIGILALTVPWVLDLLVLVARVRFPGTGLAALLIYAGYLVWGILVQPKATQPTSPASEPVHAS